MAKTKNTSPALQYVHRCFFTGKSERLAEFEETRASAEVARKVYALRTTAELTQKELAARVGTTASVISRLKDDGYDDHSLAMLCRIAAALKKRVEIRFVAVTGARRLRRVGRSSTYCSYCRVGGADEMVASK